MKEILQCLFCYYYVGLISQTINNRPFIFVAINNFVSESRKVVLTPLSLRLQSLAASLAALLQERNEFLSKQMWEGLASRSSSLSSLFLFVIIQLLGIQDNMLQSLLRSDSTNLVGNLRSLYKTKYSHVQVYLFKEWSHITVCCKTISYNSYYLLLE